MSARAVPRSVHVFTTILAVSAVGLAIDAGHARTAPAWSIVPLIAALVVGGVLELKFEYRGHLEALDLFEAALMPVVLVAPGVGAVAAVVVAKAISQRMLRVSPVKASFNVAQWAAAAGVASLLFVRLDGLGRHGAGQMVLLATAVAAGTVVNHVSVTDLWNVVTSGSNWQGSNWQGSNWQGSNWQTFDWQGSNWQGSNWQGSNWQGSNWQGSNWQGSNWQTQYWS